MWLPVAALALLSTELAYILYFRILSTAGATNVRLVTLLSPVSVILLGTAVLGEQLELKHMLGMGLICIGLSSIDGRVFLIIKLLKDSVFSRLKFQITMNRIEE